MLLMALPNEHVLTFSQYKDVKTLFAAIQTRFGGNDAIKKTQKTLLKQISLPSEWNTHVVVWTNKLDLDTMSFDDLYNNFKIVEQEVKETTNSSSSSSSQNMAFVSSPSSTNEVNTANIQVSTVGSQVITASLSDTTVYAFLASQPNGSHLVHEDLEQIHEDDLEEMDLKWQLALLSMRTRRFFQKTGRKITINGSNTAGYDKFKVECFNCHKLGHFARECRAPRNQDSKNCNQDSSRRNVKVKGTSSKSMLAIDGAGFDCSYMTDDEVPTNMDLMAFLESEVLNDKTCSKTCIKSFETLKTQLNDLRVEFNKSEFNLATYKRGLTSVEKQLVFYKKNEVMFCKQIVVLKRDMSYKDSEICELKSELEKIKQEKESNQLKIEKYDNAFKSLDKLIGSQILDKSRKCLGFVSYNAVPPPPTWLSSPPKHDLSYSSLEEFQQPEFKGYGPKTSKSVCEDISNEIKKSPDTPLVEELVSDDKLEKKTVFPTVSKIEFVRPQQQVKLVRKPANYNYHQREKVVFRNNYTKVNYNYSAQKAHPSAQRNMFPKAVLMKNGLRPLNTTRPVNTAHHKTIVFSARPMSHFSKSAQSTVKRPYQVNVVKTSACWVWRPTKLDSASITFKRHNYVDAREQFWQTATASTLENEDMEITAIIDGKVKTVSEASIRRHLKLEDFEGISDLPTIEIFEQLALMGSKKTAWEQYSSNIATRASKGYTRVDTPLFSTMLVQGQILQGEGSTIPVESHHTPTISPLTSQPQNSPTLRDFIRQETEVPQPSSPTQTHVADEAASTGVDDRHGRAATTISGLDAGHAVGRMQQNKLMDLVTKLTDMVEVLENDLKQTKKVYGVAFTKLIKKVKTLEKTVKSNKARRRANFVVSNDEEEEYFNQGRKIAEIDEDPYISLVQQIIHHDAQTKVRQEHDLEPSFEFTTHEEVYTAEPDISTTNVPIASKRGRYSKADKTRLLVELINKRNRLFAQLRAEQRRNKPMTQSQQRTYMCTYIKNIGSHTLQQLKKLSFDEIKDLFETTIKRVKYFVPMESDILVPKITVGSSKRDAKEELNQESSKRQKTVEGSGPAKESKDKESDELS
ncbi:ribonuclease H-like domain-containing protein [Tanacetum coccineum]